MAGGARAGSPGPARPPRSPARQRLRKPARLGKADYLLWPNGCDESSYMTGVDIAFDGGLKARWGLWPGRDSGPWRSRSWLSWFRDAAQPSATPSRSSTDQAMRTNMTKVGPPCGDVVQGGHATVATSRSLAW